MRGFDFVPELGTRARHNLVRSGMGERVWCEDIMKCQSFIPIEIDAPEAHDACIAFGVYPYLHDGIRPI